MTNHTLVNTIRESSKLVNLEYEASLLNEHEIGTNIYELDQVQEFRRDLIDLGNKVRLVYLDNYVSIDNFGDFIDNIKFPFVVFERAEDEFVPVLIFKEKKKLLAKRIYSKGTETLPCGKDIEKNLYRDREGQIILLAIFNYKSFVSQDDATLEENEKLTPFKRLLGLLSEEKKDIFYIFVYAVIIGLVGLALPLGLNATVELVSGGVVFTSIYLLITFVIVATLAAGALQVMQVTILEYVQRRIFTKAALEFTFRIPRIRVESILNQYAPELINRFFDVLTVQKGLPKLLIDLVTAAVQIFFGLLLLSFYHPFFVFFGLALILVLFVIFYYTGPRGLRTSIIESKYKYKVVYWLEELARAINSFKLSGNTNLPMKKTEFNVNNYLKNRSSHFKILITQYSFIILFKAVVTGGLLIIGTLLLIDRQITLGQFVASEVIIILILSSVEKMIMYMDVVYDLLTAVDKIAHVTDIPLEKSGGFNIPRNGGGKGFNIEVKDLSYKYSDSKDYALKNLNFAVECGTKLCISGDHDSGKSTLTNALSGLNLDYQGLISINGYSLKDLNLTNLRDKVAKNVSEYDIFDGTILDNILVGNPYASHKLALESLNKLGLLERVNSLPEGINSHINSGGKGFSRSFVNKLILARCLAKEPELMILKDFFRHFQKKDKLNIINILTSEENHCTLIAVSNDPIIMSACDKVLYMRDGKIVGYDSYEVLVNNSVINS